MLESSFHDYLKPVLIDAVATRGIGADALQAMLPNFADLPEAERDLRLVQVLEELSRAAAMPELGFVIGEKLPISSFGTVSLGLPVAPTLGDALELIGRFRRLISPAAWFDLATGKTEAVMAMSIDSPHVDGMSQLGCGSAIMIDRYIENYTGKRQNYIAMELTTADQQIGLAAKKYLGIEPDLQAMRQSITLPAKLLETKSATADPKTFENILAMCEMAEAALGKVRDVPTRVAEIVSARVSDPPTLEQLAQRLALSERQLRFALSRAGTSYQAMVRDARVAHAQALLGNKDLPISTVAYRLGYTDPANFTAAFKRWTGKTPRDVRSES